MMFSVITTKRFKEELIAEVVDTLKSVNNAKPYYALGSWVYEFGGDALSVSSIRSEENLFFCNLETVSGYLNYFRLGVPKILGCLCLGYSNKLCCFFYQFR